MNRIESLLADAVAAVIQRATSTPANTSKQQKYIKQNEWVVSNFIVQLPSSAS